MGPDLSGAQASPLLSAHALCRVYGTSKANQVTAVDNVDLSIPTAGLYAIVGRSGSGKSTLLQLLGGLERPDGGQIRYQGRDLARLSDRALARLRRSDFGFIFQRFNLIPTLSGRSNVLLPTTLAGGRIDTTAVDDILAWLQLDTDLLRRRPDQMSGGQQQRVAFARALAHRPSVIFADEPTGSLDTDAAHAAFSLLRRAVDELRTTVVMVTHDATLAALADYRFEMTDGVIT